MARFTDCLGREWVLRMTLGHRSGLKDIGVLMQPGDMGQTIAAFVEAFGDPEKVVALCHLLTTPAPTVTADEYAAGWDGETFERAAEALEDCIADFFLAGRRRKWLFSGGCGKRWRGRTSRWQRRLPVPSRLRTRRTLRR